MGAPKELTPAQVEQMHLLTRDRPESAKTVRVGKGGTANVRLPMRTNDIVLVTLERIDGGTSQARNQAAP
jgi:xylan 1,4-beta-xylosidase